MVWRYAGTDLEVIRINPLGLCINWVLERSTVWVIQKEGNDFFQHHEEVLGERVGSSLWPDLWLVEAGLRNHDGLSLSLSLSWLVCSVTSGFPPQTELGAAWPGRSAVSQHVTTGSVPLCPSLSLLHSLSHSQ